MERGISMKKVHMLSGATMFASARHHLAAGADRDNRGHVEHDGVALGADGRDGTAPSKPKYTRPVTIRAPAGTRRP